MNHKILYIAPKSAMSDKFATIISQSFLMERRDFTAKSLYRELIDVSMILIYASGLKQEATEELHAFLTIMPNGYIPVVLFGNSGDCKQLKNDLRYPVSAEIDMGKQPFRLDKELTDLLSKYYPAKKVVKEEIKKKQITIYHPDHNLMARAEHVLQNDYTILLRESVKELLTDLLKLRPDLLVIGYTNQAAADTEFLIAQLMNNKAASTIPIMVYGEFMSNEQRQRFADLKVKGVLADTDEPLETKEAVDSFFRKQSAGDQLFKKIQ